MTMAHLIPAILTAGAGAATLYALEPQAADPGYLQPEPVALAQPEEIPACWLDINPDPYGGRLVSAWTAPGFDGAYRLVLTRRTGGGGFDIVQEGAVEAWPGEHGPNSEVWVGDRERFSADYSVWDSSGALICERRL